MKFNLVALNKEYGQPDSLLKQTGSLYCVYIYEPSKCTHCCEVTLSYELEPLYFVTGKQVSDDLDGVLRSNLGDEKYVHCRVIDRMPKDSIETGDFGSQEEAIEYWQANPWCPAIPSEPTQAMAPPSIDLSKAQLQAACDYLNKDLELHGHKGNNWAIDPGKLAAALSADIEPNTVDVKEFATAFITSGERQAFIFAKYKGKWRRTLAEMRGAMIWYWFFSDQNNAMMAECITEIYVPEMPG